MPNRSLTDRLGHLVHWTKTVTATETPSAGVDLLGAVRAEVIVGIGTVTNIANSPQPSWTFTLQHSDAAGSGFAAVGDTDVAIPTGQDAISSGLFATVNAADEDDAVFRIGYIGNKRYIRVVATAANTPGATPISVIVATEKALAT